MVPALTAGVLFLTARLAQGLILTGTGNEPVWDPGWQAGALAVANLKTRVAWTEGPPFGGGQWTFFYRGGNDELQATLNAFSTVTAEQREVILHDGRGANRLVQDDGFDWSFTIWVRQSWERLFNNPGRSFATDHPDVGKPFPAPRLDVWLHAGGPDWTKTTVPAGVSIQDQRATSHGFPPGSGSVMRLTVTDYQDEPIRGAKLQIAATGDKAAVIKEAAADAQGAILAAGIPSGTYRLSAAAPGYAPRLLEYGQYGTNDYRVFTAKLAPAAKLTGKVVDQDGHPLGKVTVRPLSLLGPDGRGYPSSQMPEAISDDTGRFQLTGVPVGKLRLAAVLANYHYRWNPDEVMEAREDSQASSPACVLRMAPTGTVRVQLVDAEGKPMALASSGGVYVHIQEAERTGIGSWGGGAAADASGVCEFKDVPPGRYRLSDKAFPDKGQPPAINEIILTVKPGQVSEGRLRH
jgi:hypothetical protein